VAARMAEVRAAVMMMEESSATKTEVNARSAVIIVLARFIAGPDPAIAVPSSLTYSEQWMADQFIVCS
jgi:hypothetical protein